MSTRAIEGPYRDHDCGADGHTTDGGRVSGITRWTYRECAFYGCPIRVVIDAEDHEQVADLRQAIVDSVNPGRSQAVWFDDVQAALRSLIAPPKPDEPTNPKALVTDRRDNIWRLLADGDWVCTSGPDIGEYLIWDQLAGDRGPVSIEVPR